jgi:endonuclease/exonuclease/phosphatase (EEP) superfamily protein YafD
LTGFLDVFPLLAILILAVSILAGFVLAATVLAILCETRPFFGMTQHWGLQLWWLALIGAGGGAWLGIRWAAFACGISALYWSLRIWLPRFAANDTPTEPAAPLLRLMSANLLYINTRADLPDRLRAAAADVIVLIEVTPDCRDRLKMLGDTHPHAVDSCDIDPSGLYGILIRSRYPLTVLSRGGGSDAAPRHLSVRLQVEGRALDLIAVHLTNPTRWRLAPRIPGEIQDLIRQAKSGGADLILCGDCNAAGWSSWLRRLEAATGLRNQGRLLPSWPVALPVFLRLPIDHVWARGRAIALDTRLGSRTGSDHLPLLAEIGWRA